MVLSCLLLALASGVAAVVGSLVGRECCGSGGSFYSWCLRGVLAVKVFD
jgi:hypothetical protein